MSSSPLDQRMRAIAREEAQALLGTPVEGQKVDDVAELRTVVGRLEARLDALEKATGQTDQEEQPRPAARRTRKSGE